MTPCWRKFISKRPWNYVSNLLFDSPSELSSNIAFNSIMRSLGREIENINVIYATWWRTSISINYFNFKSYSLSGKINCNEINTPNKIIILVYIFISSKRKSPQNFDNYMSFELSSKKLNIKLWSPFYIHKYFEMIQ